MGDKHTACERYNVCALSQHDLRVEECKDTCQIREEKEKVSNVVDFENYRESKGGNPRER